MKKIILTTALFLVIACSNKFEPNENRLMYSNGNFYIYYNKQVIEIPKNTYITSDKKIEDYFYNFLGTHVKNEKELLTDLSRYFPQELTNFTTNEIVKGSNPIPTMAVGNKKIIDTISLENFLISQKLDTPVVENTEDNISEVVNTKVDLANKKVAILNANTINGYARNLGQKLSESLKVTYTAENNESKTDPYTYIINHKLNENELNTLVNSLGIMYVKTKIDDNLKSDSDVVIITGDDSKVNLPLEINSTLDKSELSEILSAYKPSFKKTEEKVEKISIKVSSENKYIAQLIKNKVSDAEIVIDDTVKNKIVIITNK